MSIMRVFKKKSYFGEAICPFIGRIGYPKVQVGLLSLDEKKNNSWMYDAPKFWAKNAFQIPKLVDFRTSLINNWSISDIKKTGKFTDILQESSMALKPCDIEIDLKRQPVFRSQKDEIITPHGPNAKIVKAKLCGNPKIPHKVDKVVSDIDLKAKDALLYLYNNKFDENSLMRILSCGNLGVKMQRKLVPTRWSITATDDILGKNLIKEIKDCRQTEILAQFGGYLGNYFLILYLDEVWGFELFEFGMREGQITGCTTDFEFYCGRKEYAKNCAGGYYAARLGILEALKARKRQGTCIVLRFITETYNVPLGVWVVREAVRKATETKPIRFASRDLLVRYAKLKVKKHFSVEIDGFLDQSFLLKSAKIQKKLFDFE